MGTTGVGWPEDLACDTITPPDWIFVREVDERCRLLTYGMTL